MSKPSIIVIGPAGCGKTRNAEALRKAYGLDYIIDDGSPGMSQRIPKLGALVLTIYPLTAPVGVDSVQFADAMKKVQV